MYLHIITYLFTAIKQFPAPNDNFNQIYSENRISAMAVLKFQTNQFIVPS